MSKRIPPTGAVPLQNHVITLDDGTVVRCRVGKVGKEGKYPEYIRTRWIFRAVIDGEAIESIGPIFVPRDQEQELRELAAEWWRLYALIESRGGRY